MLTVAVDASTDRLSVAVAGPDGRSATRTADGARRHAGLLVSFVEESLAEVGGALEDVTAIAISDGPGSFTGLRVAAAWAKGVVRARSIPVWTASTLLVRAVAAEAPGRLVFGVQSALRGELFVGGYRFAGSEPIVTVLEPTVVAPGAIASLGRPDVIVGDGAALAARWDSVAVIDGSAGLPDAVRLIGLIGRAGGAVHVADPARWEPTYGRPAEAQAKWEREHGRTLPVSTGVDG